MQQMLAEKGIVLAFSVVCAVLDLKDRRVPLVLLAGMFAVGIWASVTAGREWKTVLLSAAPGVLLLLLALGTEGGIGAGDGLFFLASGGFFPPAEELELFLLTVFLSAAAALGIYAVKRDRRASVPFLAPVPAALVLMMLGGAA